MPVIVARGITKRKPAMRVRSRREAMPDNLVILDRCKSRLWALQDILSTERSRHDTDVARVGSWCAELHGVAVRRGQVAGGERAGRLLHGRSRHRVRPGGESELEVSARPVMTAEVHERLAPLVSGGFPR
jgi:hypothetical protein